MTTKRDVEVEAARRRRRWSAANPGNRTAREELLAAITTAAGPQLAGSGAVLDSGCGTGWLLAALAEQGVAPTRLWGVDLAPERVRAARRRVPGAHVEVADARRLPFADDTFVVVLFVVALSSMGARVHARVALREGARVLAPGGVLLCYEPRIPTPLNRSTFRVRRSDLEAAGAARRDSLALTLLPPLSRRLGRCAPLLYPLLARIPLLRTHRLHVHSKADARAWPAPDARA